MKKIAIVAIGAGMRSARGAGVFYALRKKLSLPYANLLILSSGDAGAGVYYATKDDNHLEKMKRIWTHHLTSGKFLSVFRFWKIINIDYLIDAIFKKTEPLDSSLLSASDIQVAVSAVNARTGTVHFFTSQDEADIFEVLRATKALPLFYNKKVTISGDEYIDGNVGQSPQVFIDEALRRGATHILLCDDSSNISPLEYAGIFCFAFCQQKNMRTQILEKLRSKKSVVIPPNINFLQLCVGKIDAEVYDNNSCHLQRAFNKGVHDVVSREKKLRKFFERDYSMHGDERMERDK